jgi:hypothetical protein
MPVNAPAARSKSEANSSAARIAATFEGKLPARVVSVRPDEHAPPGERRPIAFVSRLRATARRGRDRLGKDASRCVRCFLALSDDNGRVGGRVCVIIP